MKYNPHDYQRYAAEFITTHPIAALLLDMHYADGNKRLAFRQFRGSQGTCGCSAASGSRYLER